MLFSLGFDTSSSIVLLSVSALAAEDVQKPYAVLLFPLLFASGMILVDSLDNVMMVYLYTPRMDWKRESKFKLEFGGGEDDKSDTGDSTERASLVSSESGGVFTQYGTVSHEEHYLSQHKMLDVNKYTILITALSVCVALG